MRHRGLNETLFSARSQNDNPPVAPEEVHVCRPAEPTHQLRDVEREARDSGRDSNRSSERFRRRSKLHAPPSAGAIPQLRIRVLLAV
jgi:hypothetical protein